MSNRKKVSPKIERLYWAQSEGSGQLFPASHGNYVSSIVYDEQYRKTLSQERHAPLLDIDQVALVTYGSGGESRFKFTKQLTLEGAAALEACMVAHGWGRVIRHRRAIAFTVPIRLVPSTTKGHFHLYIDAALNGEEHQRFIECCRFAGLIDADYADMVKKIRKGLLLRQGHKKTIVNKYTIMNGTERRSSPRISAGPQRAYFNLDD